MATTRTMIVLLSVLLGFITLVPRAISQLAPKVAMAHLRDYRHHDSARCRNAGAHLKQYYAETGDENAERLRQTEWVDAYRQEALFNRGIDAMNQGDFRRAAGQFTLATRADPMFWNAWTTLGACYCRLGRFDQALHALEIAQGLNPHGPSIYSNMAAVLAQTRHYAQAEKMYLKSIQLDTTNTAPYAGLTALYKAMGRKKDHQRYLIETGSRDDAPGPLLKQLGDFHLSRQRFQHAAAAYQRAMRKGLDSAYVTKLAEQHPNLRDALSW